MAGTFRYVPGLPQLQKLWRLRRKQIWLVVNNILKSTRQNRSEAAGARRHWSKSRIQMTGSRTNPLALSMRQLRRLDNISTAIAAVLHCNGCICTSNGMFSSSKMHLQKLAHVGVVQLPGPDRSCQAYNNASCPDELPRVRCISASCTNASASSSFGTTAPASF